MPLHVGDVGASDLIDPLDRDPAEPIGMNFAGWCWLRSALIEAGAPHQALDPFAVDGMALVANHAILCHDP